MDENYILHAKYKIDDYISKRFSSLDIQRRYQIYDDEFKKYIKENLKEKIKDELKSLQNIKNEILVSHEKSLLKLKALEELVIGLIKELTSLTNGVKNA